jgi:hypothetical protein
MQPDQGLIAPQPKQPEISGPGVQQVGLPNLPNPPGQFANLPVEASQMSPPSPR